MNLADLVILVATMGLNVSLLPTIRGSQKPPLVTAFGFMVGVGAISAALFWEHLWLGGSASALGSVMWGTIVFQITVVNDKGSTKVSSRRQRVLRLLRKIYEETLIAEIPKGFGAF